MKIKKIPVEYVKLGKHRSWGLYNPDNGIIKIDIRTKGKKHMEVLVHESLHAIFPDMTEEDVIENAIIITNTLWGEDYRRIDSDNSTCLQDGTI